MKQADPGFHEHYPDIHHDIYSRTTFGFWMYILSDFILFGTLFASYAVLRHSTFGGPSIKDLANLHSAMHQTLLLLICSFTMGIAGAYAHRRNKNYCLIFLLATFLIGSLFIGIDFRVLAQHIHAGHTWDKSAFLSAFFSLMGTFDIHILFGLLWLIVLGVPIIREGITPPSIRRVTCLRMFWQFLNIVWIFIFSFIYVLGEKI